MLQKVGKTTIQIEPATSSTSTRRNKRRLRRLKQRYNWRKRSKRLLLKHLGRKRMLVKVEMILR